MATYYIDPYGGSDLNSAAQAQNTATPWRTWSKAHNSGSWAAGNSFLQKRGTLVNETPTFQGGGSSEAARVTIGAYGEGPKPRIVGTDLQFGVRWFSGQSYITVQDFSVSDLTGSTTTRSGIGGGGGADNDYVIVERCDISRVRTDGANDCNGITLFGQGAIIRDNRISNISDDGIWIRSNSVGPKIYGNTIVSCGESGRFAGDCIQLDGNSIGFLIEDNTCDFVSRPRKQVFIVSSASGGYGGIIRRNLLRAPYDASEGTSVIYTDQPGVAIYGNTLEGCQYGINVQAANVLVTGNVLLRSQLGATVNGIGFRAYNNTFIGHASTGIYAPLDDSTTRLWNNILYQNVTRGIHSHGNVAKGSNCYYSNGVDWQSAGGGGAIESTAVQSDPMLVSLYRLRAASPCIGAGAQQIGIVLRDFLGKHIDGKVDIGAYQYRATRSLASSRSLASRTIVSRSASASR